MLPDAPFILHCINEGFLDVSGRIVDLNAQSQIRSNLVQFKRPLRRSGSAVVDPNQTVPNDSYRAVKPPAGSRLPTAETQSCQIFPRYLSIGESRLRRPKGAVGFVGPTPRGRGLRIVPPTPAYDSRLPLSLRRLSSRK